MGHFKKKIQRYWQVSANQKKSMAISALNVYKKRINILGAKVLEIGCGGGDFGLELAGAGASVIALDLSQQRIDTVKEKAVLQGRKLDFIVGDAQRTNFGDETFDLILCRNVIEHVSDPQQLVREMNRILKPGGSIQLTAPNRYSFTQILRDEHYRLPLVVILPRNVAAFIVCRIFKLENEYSVGGIPSYGMLRKWLNTCNLTFKMDLPDVKLIKKKWSYPDDVNNVFVRLIVKVAALLHINKIIARTASSEAFLGFFAARWSLWVTKLTSSAQR